MLILFGISLVGFSFVLLLMFLLVFECFEWDCLLMFRGLVVVSCLAGCFLGWTYAV